MSIMRWILIFQFLCSTGAFAQERGAKQWFGWLAGAGAWNITQDIYGFKLEAAVQINEKRRFFNSKYISGSWIAGRKFFEAGIFTNLPPNRIVNWQSFNLMLGTGHERETQKIFLKAGLSLNYIYWRGEVKNKDCNAFLCLGRYYTYYSRHILKPGLMLELEMDWSVSSAFGMGLSVFSIFHPSYGIVVSSFNNNHVEAGVSLCIFQFGRLEQREKPDR